MTYDSHPGVSIVVLTWNGKNLLEECLPSVVEAAQAYPGPAEVVVVDNGSTDNSVIFLEENFPTVRLVKLSTNTGFQTGCNKGVDASCYDYIVLLNNDVAVERNFIEPLIAHLASSDRVFAVGSKMFFWDRQNVFCSTISGDFKQGRFVQDWAISRDLQDTCGQIAPSLFLSGGAMAFNKQIFNALGQFDLLYYPIYWEDTDLCYRAWKRGWKVLYEPKSVVYHKVSATMKQHKLSHHLFMQRNGYLFIWRNVTDQSILIEHILRLPSTILASSRYAAQLYEINQRQAFWIEIKSFIAAVKRLPQVWQRSREDRKVQVLSDKEVLYKSNWRNFVKV